MGKAGSDSSEEKLDKLIALFKIAFSDRIDEHKRDKLKRSEIKRRIYELCSKKPCNRHELADIIGKSPDYISSYLTIMTREGLLTSKTIEKETYYTTFI